MEPDIKSTGAEAQPSLKTDPSGAITPAGGEAWQEYLTPISEFLNKLPDTLSKFYSEYKNIILSVGIVVVVFIVMKLMLALLAAINDVPLMAPIFEIVGIGYTAWFVYRYLLNADTRSELGRDFAALKAKILGGASAES